jgi:cyclophilin family peptidyl-prolyl cis-trans isomerase
MIQGGGFYPDGTKKETNDPINLEIHPDVRHVDGAIAMARTNDPNSATSQFYICDGAQDLLNDNYAAFGVTIEGIEVVQEIASVETTNYIGFDDWPVENITINSVTIQD